MKDCINPDIKRSLLENKTTERSHQIALSFDIEDWYHGAPVTGSSFSIYKDLNEFAEKNDLSAHDYITAETLHLLEILERYSVTATFFVVADVAKRYPEITEALKRSRHEIGSHSLTHFSAIDARTKKSLQSEGIWYQEQKEAKHILEDIFEREVVGFRAPNAYFANWMIPILQELGFKYDSSISFNSFYNKTNVKLHDIPAFPYRLNSETLGSNDPDSTLFELPWSNFRIPGGIILPAGGAFFFRFMGYRYFKMVLNKALKKGDSMFYMHPLDISERKFPENNGVSRPGYWISKGKKTEKRFLKLLDAYKGRFCSCIEIFNMHFDGLV